MKVWHAKVQHIIVSCRVLLLLASWLLDVSLSNVNKYALTIYWKVLIMAQQMYPAHSKAHMLHMSH